MSSIVYFSELLYVLFTGCYCTPTEYNKEERKEVTANFSTFGHSNYSCIIDLIKLISITLKPCNIIMVFNSSEADPEILKRSQLWLWLSLRNWYNASANHTAYIAIILKLILRVWGIAITSFEGLLFSHCCLSPSALYDFPSTYMDIKYKYTL